MLITDFESLHPHLHFMQKGPQKTCYSSSLLLDRSTIGHCGGLTLCKETWALGDLGPKSIYIYGLNTNLQLEILGVVLGSIDYKPTLLPIIMLLKQLAMNTLHSTELYSCDPSIPLSILSCFSPYLYHSLSGLIKRESSTCQWVPALMRCEWLIQSGPLYPVSNLMLKE